MIAMDADDGVVAWVAKSQTSTCPAADCIYICPKDAGRAVFAPI